MPNSEEVRKPTRIASALKPTESLVLGYIAVIVAGTLLLSFPAATATGQRLPLVDALFMSTSAVCVTGLTVVTPARDLSPYGHLVLLFLIQIGALGIMVMSTLFAMLLGRRITLRGRLAIQEDLNQHTISGLVRLVRYVILVTAIIEGIGALVLSLFFLGQMEVERALFLGLFHSVSAFGNAGFDLFGNSLEGFTGSPAVLLTFAALLLVGGLGFSVIAEMYSYRTQRRLSLHSRLVLRITLMLIVLGTAIVLLLEWSNPATLGPLSVADKLTNAFFTAVTPRTAGFNSVPTGQLRSATLFITMFLMYIGASPGSTGGGIKTTTFGAILAGVFSAISGSDDVEVMGRRLPPGTLTRSLAIAALALLVVIVATTILLLTESLTFLQALFEVVSAFGTVGLSTGVTSALSSAGKLTIITTMFIGRLGPMTLALALGQRGLRRTGKVRFPVEQITVG